MEYLYMSGICKEGREYEKRERERERGGGEVGDKE